MTMLKQKINEERLYIAGPNESEKDVKNRLDGACISFMADTFASVDWSALRINTQEEVKDTVRQFVINIAAGNCRRHYALYQDPFEM